MLPPLWVFLNASFVICLAVVLFPVALWEDDKLTNTTGTSTTTTVRSNQRSEGEAPLLDNFRYLSTFQAKQLYVLFTVPLLAALQCLAVYLFYYRHLRYLFYRLELCELENVALVEALNNIMNQLLREAFEEPTGSGRMVMLSGTTTAEKDEEAAPMVDRAILHVPFPFARSRNILFWKAMPPPVLVQGPSLSPVKGQNVNLMSLRKSNFREVQLLPLERGYLAIRSFFESIPFVKRHALGDTPQHHHNDLALEDHEPFDGPKSPTAPISAEVVVLSRLSGDVARRRRPEDLTKTGEALSSDVKHLVLLGDEIALQAAETRMELHKFFSTLLGSQLELEKLVEEIRGPQASRRLRTAQNIEADKLRKRTEKAHQKKPKKAPTTSKTMPESDRMKMVATEGNRDENVLEANCSGSPGGHAILVGRIELPKTNAADYNNNHVGSPARRVSIGSPRSNNNNNNNNNDRNGSPFDAPPTSRAKHHNSDHHNASPFEVPSKQSFPASSSHFPVFPSPQPPPPPPLPPSFDFGAPPQLITPREDVTGGGPIPTVPSNRLGRSDDDASSFYQPPLPQQSLVIQNGVIIQGPAYAVHYAAVAPPSEVLDEANHRPRHSLPSIPYERPTANGTWERPHLNGYREDLSTSNVQQPRRYSSKEQRSRRSAFDQDPFAP